MLFQQVLQLLVAHVLKWSRLLQFFNTKEREKKASEASAKCEAQECVLSWGRWWGRREQRVKRKKSKYYKIFSLPPLHLFVKRWPPVPAYVCFTTLSDGRKIREIIGLWTVYPCFLFSRRSVSSGAYYIKILDKTRLIYCKMENTTECGEGGWALAMKINGSKVGKSFKFLKP